MRDKRNPRRRRTRSAENQARAATQAVFPLCAKFRNSLRTWNQYSANSSFEIDHHINGMLLRICLQIRSHLVLRCGQAFERIGGALRQKIIRVRLIEHLAFRKFPRRAKLSLSIDRKPAQNELEIG